MEEFRLSVSRLDSLPYYTNGSIIACYGAMGWNSSVHGVVREPGVLLLLLLLLLLRTASLACDAKPRDDNNVQYKSKGKITRQDSHFFQYGYSKI